jgi:8-amino-7-oxononanoate synthase
MTLPPRSADSLDFALAEEHVDWAARGLERMLRTGWARSGGEVSTVDGRAVDFASNDYLGLASHPALRAAIEETTRTESVGATASRLIAGDHPEHEHLERDLAATFVAPAALSFSTGFAANVGTIPALVGAGDVVFADAFNHASLIDGCRLSRATIHVYPHSDMAALQRLVTEHRSSARRALVVSDGMFSMDGDLANIPEIVALAREFDVWTYIDDAHAVGVVGEHGRGSAEHYGMHGSVEITMGTLGKAFGAAGAFVYGSTALCRHLLNHARSFIFSTAMLPAQAAAARAALGIAAGQPQRRATLRQNATHVRDALGAVGASLGGMAESHIVPLFVGDSTETMRLGAALRARGVLVGAVRPPTVAHGGSRLRISVSAAHSSEHIDRLVRAFVEARDRS